MTTSPRLGAPELAANQAVPETTVNEQLRFVEQGAGHFIIADRDLTAPPGSPADGAAYLVKATGTGAWAGHDGAIAFYMSSGWLFVTPVEGFAAWIADENAFLIYDGSAWISPTAANIYRIGFFFTTTPAASEILALHVVSDAMTLPANLTGSVGSCGTNPTASFAIDVQRNGTSIGTITIATGGTFAFATVSGTSKNLAAGDVLKFVAPATPDATCANVAITLKGSY